METEEVVFEHSQNCRSLRSYVAKPIRVRQIAGHSDKQYVYSTYFPLTHGEEGSFCEGQLTTAAKFCTNIT